MVAVEKEEATSVSWGLNPNVWRDQHGRMRAGCPQYMHDVYVGIF